MHTRSVPLLIPIAAMLASSCASGQPPAPPHQVHSPQTLDLPDADWAPFNSRRFQMTVAFPDGKAWRINDHASEWLEATHPSSTRFRARTWTEHRLVTRESCEKTVRYWMPDLPAPSGDDVVDTREMTDFPANGFTTHLVVGLVTPPGATPTTVRGVALAIGASGRKCVAIVFTTDDRSGASAQQIASKLEIGSRMIESVVLRAAPTPAREPFDRPGR